MSKTSFASLHTIHKSTHSFSSQKIISGYTYKRVKNPRYSDMAFVTIEGKGKIDQEAEKKKLV